MVLPPMRESFLKSDNEATPQISEVITSGMAMLEEVQEDRSEQGDPVRRELPPAILGGRHAEESAQRHAEKDFANA